MQYTIREIQEATCGAFLNPVVPDSTVTNIVYDTRKITFPDSSIFFALKGPRVDGHQYLQHAYDKGIRNFVVAHKVDISLFPEAIFIICDDTLSALQKLATTHREALEMPVIAIIGSNGKTIVKEWLAQALSTKYKVGKSPLSYNSQIGVPISMLSISPKDDLAIIEAGISQKNEMASLQSIVRPTLGIITNIGDAHSQGFGSIQQKLDEKLNMFSDSDHIIHCSDHAEVSEAIDKRFASKITGWGTRIDSTVKVTATDTKEDETTLTIDHNDKAYTIRIPFTQKEMCENAMHVISYLLHDDWTEEEIQNVVMDFSTLPNRLEIKEGINDCLLINDSYSSDLKSMQLGLEQLSKLKNGKEKVLIISGMDHRASEDDNLTTLSTLINDNAIQKIFAIGMAPAALDTTADVSYYNSTEDCLQDPALSLLSNSAILIKGARKYKLERIYDLLAMQVHQTSLETDLTAIRHNLNFYRCLLKPTTKIMAVVKAEAYGSGSARMVSFLEEQKLDYLGVALIDEAVKLRKIGCRIPIMVFNIQDGNLNQLWEYDLEPEVYSLTILTKLSAVAHRQQKRLRIHIKVDTGMHRLGFMSQEIPALIKKLQNKDLLEVGSIFSHLAASESAHHDNFTHKQILSYDSQFREISSALTRNSDTAIPFRHILNTAGIIRHTAHQYDMVRLGLGLYGIDTTKEKSELLMPAHTLTARILQIKSLKKGDSTGYSRSGWAEKDTQIAIIGIGYADGLMRLAGNGRHKVLVNGVLYPTMGNICMDVTILDLGLHHLLKQGDSAIIFGPTHPIENLAKACNTISYEIISRLSPRIKRTYIFS